MEFEMIRVTNPMEIIEFRRGFRIRVVLFLVNVDQVF